ncbi:hypothetical protein [Paenibacillus tyrfis]|uniref:hypothetical protein n=1 Tax=Paenibacillus tyrfis TaxID=1501230 RepID=UPI0011807DA9|nr:hypothetical protein [Paenibacillus tyrfis]
MFERDDCEAGKLIRNIPVHKKCLEALLRDRKRFDLFTEIILKHYKMLDDCAIDLERLNSQLHGIVRNYKIVESVDKIALFILSNTLIKYVFYQIFKACKLSDAKHNSQIFRENKIVD